MKSESILENAYYIDENSIEQPIQEHIKSLCKHLGLPFNKETTMALVYGDNKMERILPTWLKELQ